MENYDQFHDGTFDGLLVDQKSAWVFLSTEQKQPYVAVAGGPFKPVVGLSGAVDFAFVRVFVFVIS
jgi:hypothetical protein